MKSEMSDLELLYRMLDIDVNMSSTKDEFSENEPSSTLSPAPLDTDSDSDTESVQKDSVFSKKRVNFAIRDDEVAVIAYESHPTIDIFTQTDVRPKCSGCDNRRCDDCLGSRAKWSSITRIYVGSITVVALYAMFRALMRKP